VKNQWRPCSLFDCTRTPKTSVSSRSSIATRAHLRHIEALDACRIASNFPARRSTSSCTQAMQRIAIAVSLDEQVSVVGQVLVVEAESEFAIDCFKRSTATSHRLLHCPRVGESSPSLRHDRNLVHFLGLDGCNWRKMSMKTTTQSSSVRTGCEAGQRSVIHALGHAIMDKRRELLLQRHNLCSRDESARAQGIDEPPARQSACLSTGSRDCETGSPHAAKHLERVSARALDARDLAHTTSMADIHLLNSSSETERLKRTHGIRRVGCREVVARSDFHQHTGSGSSCTRFGLGSLNTEGQ